jgi:hypothetical protein
VSCTSGVASEALDGVGGVLGCVRETGGLRGSGLTEGDAEGGTGSSSKALPG